MNDVLMTARKYSRIL